MSRTECTRCHGVRIDRKCVHGCDGRKETPERKKSKRKKVKPVLQLKPHYGGDLSTEYWTAVKEIYAFDENEWAHLYELGCILQEIEGRVIRNVNEALARKADGK